MNPLFVPDDAQIEAARASLHEWGYSQGYEQSFPDELLVMFFRSTMEREGWQLKLRWVPGSGFYSARWSFHGEAAHEFFCGRSLDEARLVSCAALIDANMDLSTQKTHAQKITQPLSKPNAKSIRTD